MHNCWNLEGFRIRAMYMDEFPVSGVVGLSRVKYGGGISHHITLDKPIEIYGVMRDRVIVDHNAIDRISSAN